MDLESSNQVVKPVESADQSVQDARDLAALGHDQALTRKFDMWSMLALAFCVLGMSLALLVSTRVLTAERNVLDVRAGP
jgi:hypothetical protein